MRATIADFMPENVAAILRTTHWAIISAELVNARYSQPLRDRINAARTSHLRRHLDSACLQHLPTMGRYEGVEERGSLVFGISGEQARALGQLYEQETVLIPSGLMKVATGFVIPAVGVTVGAAAAIRRGHTHLYRTGATFTVDLAEMLLTHQAAA